MTTNNLTASTQRDKPECYHAVCMYSCDACSNCKHDMDCYNHWLEYMLKKN